MLDPLLHAGTYYVQEASSMFLDDVVAQIPLPDAAIVLDLCAAPGGKSCGLISCLPSDALLVSNEIIKSRSNILAENLSKWGASNVVVTNAEPSQLAELGPTFDLIVADMPCSGEGMFRKNPAAVEEWSPENVEMCATRQTEIMEQAWEMLQPGGFLIYSTCTFNQTENEGVLADFRQENPFYQPEMTNPCPDQITFSDFKGIEAFRFLPHATQGEGFFVAVIKKPGLREKVQTYKIKEPWLSPIGRQTKVILKENMPNLPDECNVLAQGEYLVHFPEKWGNIANLLNRYVWVVKTGTQLLALQRNSATPSHHLAMSPLKQWSNFGSVELSLEQARNYLRRQHFELPHSSKGILLATYKGYGLGWLKNMGNRFNNCYPQEWRIRHV